MKKRYLSFAMAVCMICCLTMTSCSAAEIPAANGGTVMENTALLFETQGGSSFDDVAERPMHSKDRIL